MNRAIPILLALALAPAIPAGRASAQPAMLQDSTLDNLAHDAGYVAAAPGELGAVVERGDGPLDMVLVSGFGLGASAFEAFMERNRHRYRMLAVTLPGFEGTAAPPMPEPGASYGDQSWTRAAGEAVARLIRSRKLDRPVVVGHFLNGTQVAMRVAREHPELVRAVVLLAGSPRFEPVRPSRSWPAGLDAARKVEMVDRFLAPRWFRTVTRETWVRNNFGAADYSVDRARGTRFAGRANAPPLPVLVRWLCEYHASDLWPELDKLEPPLLVIQPRFDAAARADSTRSYLQAFFEEPWRGRLEGRPRTESAWVDDAGILVMDDQPALVDRRIAAFLERHAR